MTLAELLEKASGEPAHKLSEAMRMLREEHRVGAILFVCDDGSQFAVLSPGMSSSVRRGFELMLEVGNAAVETVQRMEGIEDNGKRLGAALRRRGES